jgi:large subunit ribosomal protein L21
MSKIAVIKTGGKQYVVREGDVLKVEKLATTESTINFDEVLLSATADGSSLDLGQPKAKAKVTAKVTQQGRAKKVIVIHYKAKVRYHKKAGHRQPFTEVKIEKIN